MVRADGGGNVEVGERDLATAAAIQHGQCGARRQVVLYLLGRPSVFVDQDDGCGGSGSVLHLRSNGCWLWRVARRVRVGSLRCGLGIGVAVFGLRHWLRIAVVGLLLGLHGLLREVVVPVGVVGEIGRKVAVHV